jgi:tetratricopeptide (TPR) repeat protein
MRLARPWMASAGLGLLVACAPALREPPPVAVLGERPGATTSEVTGPADVDRQLAEAESQFSRRPDMGAVASAYDTFLAAARADEARVEGLLGASRVAAWMIEHEPDAGRRRVLATEAVQACQWCVKRAPSSVACQYRLALALGQQARERRSTAKDALSRMVALLEQVVAADPRYDKAGGHRVLALVLLRAPGWPAGPGDPEAALQHARRADELFPDDADNLLALAEALAKTGAHEQALIAYQRAERIARARAAAGDPDAADLVESAARALKK